jgi:AcrR family transcriptional regulator
MVTQSNDRRAREKVELRSKILNAARSLFARQGYAAVTMREIARKIGYTATALYYHFPDKESLLRELCETDFRSLSDSFRRLGRVGDPVERIRRTGRAYVDFGLEHPQHYRLMFMTPHPQPSPDELCIERGNPEQDAYAFLRQAVQEALAAGRFRPDLKDADLIVQALWAGVHGVVALHLNKADSEWVDWRPPLKTSKLLHDALLRGLLR